MLMFYNNILFLPKIKVNILENKTNVSVSKVINNYIYIYL